MKYNPIIFNKKEFPLLQKIIQSSWNISFYKKFYSGTHCPRIINSIDDIKKIPILRQSLLEKTSLSNIKKESYRIIYKNNSLTRDTIQLPLSKKDYQNYIKFEAYKFQLSGVKKTDKCSIIAFSQNATIPMAHALLSLGATYIPLDGDENSIFQDIINEEITVLFTVPQVVYRLLKFLRCHKNKSSLRLIITTGVKLENFSQTIRDVHTITNANIIDSIGSTELASFSLSYPDSNDYYYFLNKYMVVEIIDPITNEPSKNGEIVITPLWKTDFPLIRYGTGDYISLTKKIFCKYTKQNTWIFSGIQKRLDNTIRMERYLNSIETLYEKIIEFLTYQYIFDKILWRLIQPPVIILLLTQIDHKDVFIVCIEKTKSIFTLRKIQKLKNFISDISSTKTYIIQCEKNELTAITPKYQDLRQISSSILSSSIKKIMKRYQEYFL